MTASTSNKLGTRSRPYLTPRKAPVNRKCSSRDSARRPCATRPVRFGLSAAERVVRRLDGAEDAYLETVVTFKAGVARWPAVSRLSAQHAKKSLCCGSVAAASALDMPKAVASKVEIVAPSK